MVKPQTILLVDDHSLITTAMSALLQSMYPDGRFTSERRQKRLLSWLKNTATPLI